MEFREICCLRGGQGVQKVQFVQSHRNDIRMYFRWGNSDNVYLLFSLKFCHRGATQQPFRSTPATEFWEICCLRGGKGVQKVYFVQSHHNDIHMYFRWGISMMSIHFSASNFAMRYNPVAIQEHSRHGILGNLLLEGGKGGVEGAFYTVPLQ